MTDDDRVSAQAGYAQVTTEPIPLTADVSVVPADESVKLLLSGDDDLPDGGVRAMAYLDRENAAALAERLAAAADELYQRREAEADP
jgi:hypothetical protein